MDINLEIDRLVAYAVNEKLLPARDRTWAVNRLLEILYLSDYTPSGFKGKTPEYPCEILKNICDWAVQQKVIPQDTVTQRDLLDTKLMGVFARKRKKKKTDDENQNEENVFETDDEQDDDDLEIDMDDADFLD